MEDGNGDGGRERLQAFDGEITGCGSLWCGQGIVCIYFGIVFQRLMFLSARQRNQWPQRVVGSALT